MRSIATACVSTISTERATALDHVFIAKRAIEGERSAIVSESTVSREPKELERAIVTASAKRPERHSDVTVTEKDQRRAQEVADLLLGTVPVCLVIQTIDYPPGVVRFAEFKASIRVYRMPILTSYGPPPRFGQLLLQWDGREYDDEGRRVFR